MKSKKISEKRRTGNVFVVAPASAYTWVVAFSRHVIPGALFKSKDAALQYASTLARAAGLQRSHVRVLT